MRTQESANILMLPGLGDSGPGHWQSIWQREIAGAARVTQRDWNRPSLSDWVLHLDRAVLACPLPPILVAHSLACALVAQWGGRMRRPVRGAFLVAPADIDSSEHTPPEVRGFGPMPLSPMPFPTTVVASGDDPYVSVDRARTFARAWKAHWALVERGGHLNADSGFGPWPEGRRLLEELINRTAPARPRASQ